MGGRLFPRLHVQMTAMGAREMRKGAAMLMIAGQYGGQSVENMRRTPHERYTKEKQ